MEKEEEISKLANKEKEYNEASFKDLLKEKNITEDGIFEKDDQKININEQSNADNQPVKPIKPSTDIADSIVTILVDKIIADAVINSKVNDIYKTLNSHCFDFLTNCVNKTVIWSDLGR